MIRVFVLWCAFVAVHVLTAVLGWVYPSGPMGDVVIVYQPWASAVFGGGPVVGITETWVYPQLALVPMLLAAGLSAPLIAVLGVSSAYLVGWAALVTILDAVAFGVLVTRSPSSARRAAAWFWCAAVLLLGPIALYRIDAITVPIAVIGGLWLVSHPAVAAVLLAIGAWIKIWPGAFVFAAVVAARTRWRVVLCAALVSVGVVVVLFLLGADSEIFGFLTEQTERGLQIEAVAATPFLWLAVAGAAQIEYSFEILTFQITASGVHAVAVALTPLMVISALAATVIGAVKARRGAAFSRLFPPLALVLVALLIVTNKVGSPQFQTWLIAPVIMWIVLDRVRSRTPTVMVLALCLLTFLVYPINYDALLRADAFAVAVLSARNVLLVMLLVLGIRALMRVPVRPPNTKE